MKKLIALTLGAASVFAVQAQDVKALYEQAKKLDDTFTKARVSPTVEDAKGLLDAIEIYDQILEAENNTPKPKYTKKIMDAMTKHAMGSDFNIAAVALFNGGMPYPEAYNAFMMSGTSAKEMQLVPDTVYAVDFYNAGNSAYGRDFAAAAAAYDAAIEANIPEVQAFVYAIGARQNLGLEKPELKDNLNEEIHQIAAKGLERFGYDQDFIFNNYLQYFFDKENYEAALYELEKAEKQNPENANIYRLRGIISNAKHDYIGAVPAFIKMSELTDKFDYLIKAASDLNSVGKAIMGGIANPTPEDKATILNVFNSALEIANKAKLSPDANVNKVNDEIEDIEYNITNANKL